MKIRIYQVDTAMEEGAKAAFMHYEYFRKKYGAAIPERLYKKVFEGDVTANSLEGVFCAFNQDDRPNAFEMRSMSVSDIVEVIDGDTTVFHFCDMFGFKEVLFGPEKREGESHDPT